LFPFPTSAKFLVHQDEGIRSHQPANPQQGGSLHGDVVGQRQRSGLPDLLVDEIEEAHMATQIPRPLAVNRRQLLATVAAIPMSGILPPQATADAVPVPSIPTSEPSPLNVFAATARRIEEITARNRIRAEACLPLLSIPKELRRMKEADDAAAFEAFANSHRGAVWDEVLTTMREARGEPNWHPSDWMQGMAAQAEISSALRQRFERSRNA
jgi:hypothetical protein